MKFKHRKSTITEKYRKLDMLLFLKAFQGILFIKAKLQMIQYAKNIFILDLEQGQEAFILKEL